MGAFAQLSFVVLLLIIAFEKLHSAMAALAGISAFFWLPFEISRSAKTGNLDTNVPDTPML